MMGGMIEQFAEARRTRPRPVVITGEWIRGFRVSKVVRPDGSSFTVSVPSLGVDDGTEHLAPRHRWIRMDGGQRDPSCTSVLRLVAALSRPAVCDQAAR